MCYKNMTWHSMYDAVFFLLKEAVMVVEGIIWIEGELKGAVSCGFRSEKLRGLPRRRKSSDRLPSSPITDIILASSQIFQMVWASEGGPLCPLGAWPSVSLGAWGNCFPCGWRIRFLSQGQSRLLWPGMPVLGTANFWDQREGLGICFEEKMPSWDRLGASATWILLQEGQLL